MRTRTSSKRALRMKVMTAAIVSCFASTQVLGNPTGATIVNGTVSMDATVPGVLNITNSPGSIINWNTFSIGAGQLTRFQQQSAASAVLNRVTGTSGSEIYGTLTSNGRVFLINPNGILFGAGAVVDVAGLVASTLNLSDRDFLDGQMRFQEVPGARSVENFGTITTQPGGQVYLVGPAVTNGGLIQSSQGEVVLAAGNSVELMSTGTPALSVRITAPDNEALNLGQIIADSGRVGIFAGLVRQRGMVSANTAVTGADGTIRFKATASTTLAAGSSTSASGALDIDTGDLTVAGNVTSGPQTISATGTVSVVGDAISSGSLSAFGGQIITARSMEVTAQDGGSAFVSNSGFGDQTITLVGGGAGAGLDVRALSGPGVANIDNQVAGGTQSISVFDADHISIIGMGTGGASILAVPGNQNLAITGSGANEINFGSAGALGFSQIGASHQTVTAGAPWQSGSITIIGSAANGRLSGMVSQPGAGNFQSVSTSGALTILGGSAPAQPSNFPAGIFHNGTGQQYVQAGSILLQGGPAGSGNAAIIGANNGSQNVSAGLGGITLIGGMGGANNSAGVNQNSSDPTLTQTVLSAGDVLLQGGDGGTANSTQIRALGGHQSYAAGNTILLGGLGGTDNFATIQARSQDVGVFGDLTLTGRGSGRTTFGGGVKLGGLGGAAASPTQLALYVYGNLTMTGGSADGAGATIGNTVAAAVSNDINALVFGDVTLTGGSAPNTNARFGAAAGNGGAGSISINAVGMVALNGATPIANAQIRTAGDVSLTAQRITQGPEARIEASSLAVQTQEGASLTGANSVSTLSAPNGYPGDMAFNNTSPLLTVAYVSTGGGLALRQQGDLLVEGGVYTGPQSISVTGGLHVQNQPGGYAQLSASGGQTIDAGYVQVTAVNGGSASISNFNGDQRISTSGMNSAGEGLAVRNIGESYGGIVSDSGNQIIEVRNADRVVVDGGDGYASVYGLTQSISLTGSGTNALVLGSSGVLGGAALAGGSQTIVAGNPGEQGSITLYGSSGGTVGTFINLTSVPGGVQTISTSGALSLYGGSGPGASAAIFGFAEGATQSVRAESILLRGGTGSNDSGAMILANGVSQDVEAGSGGIRLLAGEGGVNNFAHINHLSSSPTATQTVLSEGGVLLHGGATGSGNSALIRSGTGSQRIDVGPGGVTLIGGASGSSNSANIVQVSTDLTATQTVRSEGDVFIQAGDGGNLNFAQIRALGGHQSYEAGNTTLLGGLAGTDNFATIQAPSQDMTVHGDLALTARGSGRANFGGGVRIGSIGGATPSPTQLTLLVDGNLTMTGGSAQDSAAVIGSSIPGALPNDINVVVGGDVTLDAGTAAGTHARLGAIEASSSGGAIDITAGGTIALNNSSPDAYSLIRTADAVNLTARSIAQGPDSRIQAGSLTTRTREGASLAGANAVGAFNAINTASGAVAFNNAAPLLTVTGIDQVADGALALAQSGDLLISGNVSSGMQQIAATGNLTIDAGTGSGLTVQANGAQTFSAGASFSLLGGSARDGFAQTLSAGPAQVYAGDDIVVRGGSGALAYALLYGSESVGLTIGNALRIDGGASARASARIEAGTYGTITLDFPTLAGGGYFVNGVEGATHRGRDGLFIENRPARLGRSLIVNYGQ